GDGVGAVQPLAVGALLVELAADREAAAVDAVAVGGDVVAGAAQLGTAEEVADGPAVHRLLGAGVGPGALLGHVAVRADHVVGGDVVAGAAQLGTAEEVADGPAVHRLLGAGVGPGALLGHVAVRADHVVDGVEGVAGGGDAVVDQAVAEVAVDAGEVAGQEVV